MRKYYLIIFLFLAGTSSSFCQQKGFGIGFAAGDPTGISGKVWLLPANAIDFGIGWNTNQTELQKNYGRPAEGQSAFHFHADYLWHDFSSIKSTEKFGLFYGVGCTTDNSGGGGDFGARGVLGVEWIPRGVHLDVFVEIAPIFFLAPSTDFGINGGVGARYFFQ